MSDIDKDLQRRLRAFADGISPAPGRSGVVIRSARTKRRLVALSAGLAVVLALGGLAGAATLLGDRDGIRPAPGPEETSDCVSAGYDLAVFVPEKDFHDKMVELNELLRGHEGVASFGFVSAAEALQEYLRANPDDTTPIPTSARRSQYRVTLEAGIDPHRLSRELADLSDGAFVPAPDCRPSEPQQQSARYMFDVTEGRASASGSLDVDTAAAKLCLTLASNNITASHLLLVEPDRPDQQGTIIFTFLDRDDAEQGLNLPMSRQCFQGDELRDLTNQLQLLVDEPERFAIEFDRGPNDERGLIAELVPVAQEQDFSGPLEDTIEAQGGKIRLQVIPDSIGRGSIAEILVINETASHVMYGHAYVLEERDPGGWKHVKSAATCAFTEELLSIAPGEETRHPIGHYGKDCKVLPLRQGSYRVTKEVELASGERLPLSVTFSITPGAKKRQILEQQLADARTTIAVRELVRSFMERRMAGARAEEFLDRHRRADFRPGGDLAPLYPDPPLQDFHIEFVDDLGDGSYEVGVSLVFQKGSYGETLFVHERDGELVISGGRPGLEGP